MSVKTCSTVLVKAPHDHNIFNFVLELDPIMFKKTILKIKHWRVEKKSTAKLGKGYLCLREENSSTEDSQKWLRSPRSEGGEQFYRG